VLYSFDSRYLASADQEGVIKIWSMPEGTLLQTIKAHTELIQDVSFACDNQTLVSASLDKTVKLWNILTGANLMTMTIDSEIWGVDLTCDAKTIILGCADGTVRFLTKKLGK
jgi:WD40 repeat protein